MSYPYTDYERITFPCGCEACFYPKPTSVNPDGKGFAFFCHPLCKWDAERVGQYHHYMIYLAFEDRHDWYAKREAERAAICHHYMDGHARRDDE